MSKEGVTTGSEVKDQLDAAVVTGNDGEKQSRRPQSAGRQSKGRGSNRGRVYNNNQQDRQLVSAHSGQYPNAVSFRGYHHPRVNAAKHRPNKGDRGYRHADRVQYKVKNDHDKEEKVLGDQETVQESQQAACHQAAKMEAEGAEVKQTMDVKGKEVVGDSHTDAKSSAELSATRQRTSGKIEKVSVDKPRGKGSKRNYSQGTRYCERAREHHNGNHDFTPVFYDGQDFLSGPAMQERTLHKSIFPNKVDFSSSGRQPNFNFSEHEYGSNKLHNPDSSQRRLKGETAAAKIKKHVNRRNYKSQKEDVLRTLSHLNPLQSSQASVLIEQLRNETYECMVCCDRIRCSAAVWNCCSCYHLFHLGCVRKWAKSPAATAATAAATFMEGMINNTCRSKESTVAAILGKTC